MDGSSVVGAYVTVNFTSEVGPDQPEQLRQDYINMLGNSSKS